MTALPPKWRWAPLVMGALALVGWTAHWHVYVSPQKNVTQFVVPGTPHSRVQARAGDGYMTAADCIAVKDGTKYSDVIDRYGFPHGDQWYAPFGLDYKLREDHDRTCTIDFDYRNKIETKSLDLP